MAVASVVVAPRAQRSGELCWRAGIPSNCGRPSSAGSYGIKGTRQLAKRTSFGGASTSHSRSGFLSARVPNSLGGWRSKGRFRMQSSDDNSTESLFQRELRRRGIPQNPSSNDSSKSDENNFKDPVSSSSSTSSPGETTDPFSGNENFKRVKPPPSWSTDVSGQLERSRALNSEGLEGLIPRASELIKLGTSFSVSFFPLALVFVALFVSVYLYFGQGFIHSGSKYSTALPQYIDPYQLLQEEEAYQRRVPYNSYNGNNYNGYGDGNDNNYNSYNSYRNGYNTYDGYGDSSNQDPGF